MLSIHKNLKIRKSAIFQSQRKEMLEEQRLLDRRNDFLHPIEQSFRRAFVKTRNVNDGTVFEIAPCTDSRFKT